jgi:hypothetical protein
MATWHRHYELGDIQPSEGPEDYIRECEERGDIILPLYLYDHSGLSMSTSRSSYPFNCPWDSGMVGIIHMTKADAIENWGKKICTKAVREKAIRCMISEVEEYNQYLTGDVWGIIIDRIAPDANGEFDESQDGDEIDSCWGFYGYDYAEEEGIALLKSSAEGYPAIEHARQNSALPYKQVEAWGQLTLSL